MITFVVLALVWHGHLTTAVIYGDYCEGETFSPACQPNEVILIQEASFGRMRLGRCVTTDMGYLGCFVSVFDAISRQCSGRHQCDVRVADLSTRTTEPCPADLQSYLEVGYICVEGPDVPDQCHSCTSPVPVPVSNSTGFLPSLITQETGCGSADCPWLLQGQPGQTFRVFLFDPLGDPDSAESDTCRVLAVIREGTGPTQTVCQGVTTLFQPVYTSESHSVEVRIISRDEIFMIYYYVEGCADPAPPPGGWQLREGDTITRGCDGSDGTWTLTCNDNGEWIGLEQECETEVPVDSCPPDENETLCLSRKEHEERMAVLALEKRVLQLKEQILTKQLENMSDR